MGNPKSWFTILKNRVGLFPLLITFFLIILLIYLSVSTRWIPTTKRINRTGEYNMTVELDGVYSYVHNDYIEKTRDFETTNPQIPKGSLEPEKAFLLIFLVILLVCLMVTKKEKLKDPAEKKEVEEEAQKYLDRLKGERKIKGGKVLTQGALRRRQMGEGELKPDLWMIPANQIMADSIEEYHLLLFNPHTKQLFEDRKLEREFKGVDRCDKCGKYSDLKIVRPSDLKILDELFGWTKK